LVLLEPLVAGVLPRDFALCDTTTAIEPRKAIAYFGLVVYYKFKLYNIGYYTMSTFEHPQQSRTPEQASFEPTPPPEAIEREKTQIDAISGIGSAACDAMLMDTLDAAATHQEEPSGEKHPRYRKVITNDESYEGTPIKIPISDEFFAGSEGISPKNIKDQNLVSRLLGRLNKEQSLFEKLSTKLYYHRKVLAYLAKRESKAIAAGDKEEHQAILDLQFTVIPIIDDLEKQLNAIEQRRSSRFTIDSSVVG